MCNYPALPTGCLPARRRANPRPTAPLRCVLTCTTHWPACFPDRRYLFRTYRRCFVGQEAVAWMVASGWAADTRVGVRLGMNELGCRGRRGQYTLWSGNTPARP